MTINQLFLNFARALRLIRVINYNPESLLGPLCMDDATDKSPKDRLFPINRLKNALISDFHRFFY